MVFPTVVGRPLNYHFGYTVLAGPTKSEYIGDEAMQKRGVLNIERPIKDGVMQSSKDMEKIWHHTFLHGLKVAPEEVKGVLLANCGSGFIKYEHRDLAA